MKKTLSIILVVAMVLALCACGGGEGKEETPKLQGFNVGYGRVDISPEEGILLGGYSDTDRFCEGVMDYLFTTCIALTDDSGSTVLLITCDAIRADGAEQIRTAVSNATGVPFDSIIYSTTHSHSAPETTGEGSGFVNVIIDGTVKAAKEALADRSPATAEIASDHVPNLSFVRHYVMTNGKVQGDNFWYEDGTPVAHTTEADDLLQVIRFNRGEEKKPVVMINWQGHPVVASSTTAAKENKENFNLASSDYIGPTRQYVEEETDCLFAFFLSGSGNLNAYSRIKGEGVKNHRIYGEKLGKSVVKVLEGEMKQVNTDTVASHALMCEETKSPQGGSSPYPYNVVTVGDLSFVTSPSELFDTTARAVKDNTPYEMTFVLTLTNGRGGYMPTSICWDYFNCYEIRLCYYEKGTAEILQQAFIDSLNELHGK